jgi:hypothetical protein
MPDRPSFADEYTNEQLTQVRATCLYLATLLGDFLDQFVVVGGLVPSLLISGESLPDNEDPHVGTRDLDLGLALALLDAHRYENLTERLRTAGFEPDTNEQGNRTFQRWKIEPSSHIKITIDFLIPPSLAGDKGGQIRHIEEDFAAIITPGLHLAFEDRETITLSDITIFGERATREIQVCGPGAYVVLKALAFGTRGENKDAYDLYYVIRNYGQGIDDVYERLEPLLNDPDAQRGLDILRRDFFEPDNLGPMRAAAFLFRGTNDELQADVAGFVRELVSRCEKTSFGGIYQSRWD